MVLYIFLALALLSIASALMVVLTRNPVHSVLYLIFTFFILAAQYVLLNAQFLAIVHLIVYSGAIMVLFLFVLMMLNLNQDTEPQKSVFWKVGGVVASGLMLVTLVGAMKGAVTIETPANSNPGVGLVENLGRVLFTDFVLPFEIAGILFLAAMVGAVLVGKRDLRL
ncbi:MAG: NADH-quinone oxidoreductase subunit J [Saprospiraceae bacterium]